MISMKAQSFLLIFSSEGSKCNKLQGFSNFINKRRGHMKITTLPNIIPEVQSERQDCPATPSRRIKTQIDAILQNDYAVLARQLETDPNSLLTKHNNPLILSYVKNIYQEYNIKDPLPNWNPSAIKSEDRIKAKDSSLRRRAKLHLYSSLAHPSPYHTPIRRQNHSPSQNLYTEPIPQPHDADPEPDGKDLIQSQITVKKYYAREQTTTLKASNSYFDNNSAEPSFTNPLNENSNYQTPDRFPIVLSRKYEKGYEMRIETEEPFEDIDENLEKSDFSLPLTPTLPGAGLCYLDQLCPSASAGQYIQQQLNIEGAQQAQSRLMMPYPLPEIVTSKSTPPPQQKEIKQSFRYCIGCEQALLDANIQIHEKKCKEFQLALEMTPAELVQHLKGKIHKFEGNIQRYSQQLLAADAAQIGQHSRRLMEQSQTILGAGNITPAYQLEYGSVVEISRKWCVMTEEINKVNWFLKIRERVRQELEL